MALQEIIRWRPAILGKIAESRHALIEASAGTGKTHTMGHLLVDLVLSGAATVDQILVVTFTVKATAELRARIRSLIQDILRRTTRPSKLGDEQRAVLDPAAQQRLYDALYAFDDAAVFTIHGFCQRVLTELAFQSGTPFSVDVVDARSAFHAAFRAELRENFAVDQHVRELLTEWMTDRKMDDLESLLLAAHQKRYWSADSAGAPRLPELARRLTENFDPMALTRECRALNLTKKQESGVLGAIDRLKESIRKARGSAEALLALFESFDFLPMQIKTPAAKPPLHKSPAKSPLGIRALLELANEIKIAVSAQASLERKLLNACLPVLTARLERDKREQGRIDYDDMLLWVWRALEGEGSEALLQVLRDRYRYALVDEFQDTDDLQWRIFKRIFVDSPAGNGLFVVGDPKQAIYSFRGADVYAYLRARRELTSNGAVSVPLEVNFRSTGNLIAAQNLIFDQNATTPFFSGEIRYEHPARCGMRERKAVDSSGAEIIPVTLMRYVPDGKGTAGHARETIGRYIAATIRRLIGGQSDSMVIEDGEQRRSVLARDIFILTRTNNECREIGTYLRDAGVPFAFYKLEGLFQTGEAADVLEVLRAIHQPHDRSRRLRAWGSPFFAVRHRDLPMLEDLPTTHPLYQRLYEWQAMAETERFTELFESLLHDSGLAERELFLSGSERELTNYIHIFEVLLEQAIVRRLSLGEIIELLAGYVGAVAQPLGPDGNIQRLESERAAVQIMTVHMSKGLEADVVFLYGGTHDSSQHDNLVVYHENGQRKFAIGKVDRGLVGENIKQEALEENRRLLYVALTRARAKLFLPFFPKGSLSLSGYYKLLNERLLPIASPPGDNGRRRNTPSNLFALDDVCKRAAAPVATANQLTRWSPPANLLNDNATPEETFRTLRREHHALVMHSYTSLKRADQTPRWNVPLDDFKVDLEPPVESADLPGGSQVGIYLHEVLERIDLASLAEAPNFHAWKNRPEVATLFRDAMNRHQIREQRWFERGLEIIFKTLSAKIALADGRMVGPLHACPNVREMEFVYPIPASAHPALDRGDEGRWTVERGYLKGFVDFVFKHEGLIYFADWKSDLLDRYDAKSLEEHVIANYQLQARIYSVGIIRLLRIRNEREYHRRFGGLLYVFLRGINSESVATEGVYFHRPEWAEVCRCENELSALPGLN